jgi:DNA-binding transcriptional LysR family regulator
MHLTIRHLQVFEALMEAGSVSRAAERMNLTQPAVSVALSNLEKDLGFRLFHRSKGYFAPTDEAELLHAEAELALLAVERFRARAREIALGAVGGVTVASNGACAINFLPKLIADFRRSHPGVHIDLKVRSSRQVASWVAGGQIDVGLLDAPVPVAGVDAHIFRLPCVCIMREDDPLCDLARIGPADLAGRSIIAITGDHSVDRQI